MKRTVADLQLQLAEAHTQIVLLQGVAPQSAAAAALAQVAAAPLPGGNGNGKAPAVAGSKASSN
jgi:hypothetical protein